MILRVKNYVVEVRVSIVHGLGEATNIQKQHMRSMLRLIVIIGFEMDLSQHAGSNRREVQLVILLDIAQ